MKGTEIQLNYEAAEGYCREIEAILDDISLAYNAIAEMWGILYQDMEAAGPAGASVYRGQGSYALCSFLNSMQYHTQTAYTLMEALEQYIFHYMERMKETDEELAAELSGTGIL